jgi:predicted DNA-binding transcriptional regulator AlpA
MINRSRIDLWPLGLTRIEAAQYIGVSQTLFSRMVQRGDMPAAKQLSEGRIAWDRGALDLAFAALPSHQMTQNPWDENE